MNMEPSPMGALELDAIVNRVLETVEEPQDEPDSTLYCYEEMASEIVQGEEGEPQLLHPLPSLGEALELRELQLQGLQAGSSEEEHEDDGGDVPEVEEEAQVQPVAGPSRQVGDYAVPAGVNPLAGQVEALRDQLKALAIAHAEVQTHEETAWEIKRARMNHNFLEQHCALVVKLEAPIMHRMIAVSTDC